VQESVDTAKRKSEGSVFGSKLRGLGGNDKGQELGGGGSQVLAPPRAADHSQFREGVLALLGCGWGAAIVHWTVHWAVQPLKEKVKRTRHSLCVR
jgi:hypothetical protein